MARIVIAGANGKVGRILVGQLMAAGHEVIALVRTELVPAASRCVTDWMNAPLPAADPDRYLRTKAEAEAATLATARSATILRTVYICGTPDSPQESDLRQQTPKGRAARCFGNGRSRYRPLLINDVVRATLTCIDRRLPGAFALEGKDVLSSDQIIRLLNRDPDKAIRHFPRRLARAMGPMIGITRDFVDILIEDQLCTDPNVFDVCGVVPGSVQQAWR